MLLMRTMAGVGREEAAKPSMTLRRESGAGARLSGKTTDMLLPPAVRRGLALLGLPLQRPHPTIRGNHLGAAGRLVKVPAFVLMSHVRRTAARNFQVAVGYSGRVVSCRHGNMLCEKPMSAQVQLINRARFAFVNTRHY